MTRETDRFTNQAGRRARPRPAWTEAEIQYVLDFQAALRRRLARHARGDLDEVVQREVLLLVEGLAAKMAKYPSAVALAAGRARNGRAYRDYLRRLKIHDDWDEANPWDDGPRRRTAYSPAHSFDDASISNQMLRRALLRLPLDQREVLILVDVEGFSVTEAAEIRGETRETTSRKRHDAYRILRSSGGLEPPC